MKCDDPYLKELIFEHSEKMILRQGVRGINLDVLASSVGIAKNTLYKIVGSKKQLVEAIVFSRALLIVDTCSEIFDKEKDISKAMYMCLDAGLEILSRWEMSVLPDVYRHYPDIRKKVGDLTTANFEKIYYHIENAKNNGVLRKDFDLGFIVETVRCMFEHYVSQGLEIDEFKEKLRKLTLLIFHAILV